MTETDISPAKRQRIAKLMARAGLCSRRDAEAWILDGRVTVNGAVIASPALDVGDDDAIMVDDVPLPSVEKTRLFLFHKPRGLVTSDRDPEGRETVADYLQEHWPDGPRVVTIGRLDINTEGLLLLTNDGGLARTLELPQTGWVRRYRVRAKGTANPADLDALRDGLTIDGIDYAGIEAKLDRVQGANSWLTMGLREGKNREIKRVLEHLGLEVNRLIRLSFGPFQLLDLEEGAVEEVKTRVLRDQLGEKLAEQAGVDFGETAPIVPAPVREERKGSKPAVGRDKPKPRRDGPSRDRPDRPPRPPSGRDGTRPLTRFSARPRHEEDEKAPIRERPAASVRKHVSTLRASEAEDSRKGPRKRIERTDTRDRRDRTVTVERLVSARPAPASGKPPRRRSDAGPYGKKRTSAQRSDGERGDGADFKPRGARGDGPHQGRRDDARGDRRHASPSALGKRERMSRSGGVPARDDRSRGDRDERRPARDARPRVDRPDRERVASRGDRRPAHDVRQPRTERGEHSERPARDDRRPARNARPPRAGRPDRPASRPSDDRRAERGGGERRPGPGADRQLREDRPMRPRPAGGDRPERRGDKAPRPRSAGRPMGAASRKPNSRKGPPAGGGGRPGGKPRGPSKPRT